MTRRPTGRSRRFAGGASAPTELQLAIAAADGRPFFTMSRYIVDDETGKVAAFVDWNDPTHLLAQAVEAAQVAIPAAHADFGGQLCATFTGAEYYVSNRAASTWQWALEEAAMYTTLRPTSTGTRLAWELGPVTATSQYGYHLLQSGTGYVSTLARGGGAFQQQTTALGTVEALQTPRRVRQLLSQTAPLREQRVTGGTLQTSDAALVGSSGVPSGTLVLGAREGGTVTFAGRLHSLVFADSAQPAIDAWLDSTGIVT